MSNMPGNDQQPENQIPPPPPGGGAVTDEEKNLTGLMHLLSIVLGFLSPLIFYLLKKDQMGDFFKVHCMQSLAWQIGIFILYFLAGILTMVCIGFAMIPIILVLNVVFPIFAWQKASKGEMYDYPVTGKFAPAPF